MLLSISILFIITHSQFLVHLIFSTFLLYNVTWSAQFSSLSLKTISPSSRPHKSTQILCQPNQNFWRPSPHFHFVNIRMTSLFFNQLKHQQGFHAIVLKLNQCSLSQASYSNLVCIGQDWYSRPIFFFPAPTLLHNTLFTSCIQNGWKNYARENRGWKIIGWVPCVTSRQECADLK